MDSGGPIEVATNPFEEEFNNKLTVKPASTSTSTSTSYSSLAAASPTAVNAAAASSAVFDLTLERTRAMSALIAPFEESKLTDYHITVSDPEMRGGTFSKYVSYAISVTPKLPGVINVRRRFNDFLWLREMLCKFAPGYFVPPLPPKQALGRFNEDFLDERQGDMERFLNRVAADAILSDNVIFKMFLCRHENSFDDGKKEIDKWLQPDFTDVPARYHKMFPEATSRSLPDSFNEELLQLKEFLEHSEKELTTLLELSRLIKIKSTELAAEQVKFAEQLSVLSKVESNFAHCPSPKRVDVLTYFSATSKISSETPDVFDGIVSTMKFELQDVQAFLEILQSRDDLANIVVKATTRADKWRAPPAANAAPLTEKQLKQKDEDIKHEGQSKSQLEVIDQVIRSNTLSLAWNFKVTNFKTAMMKFAKKTADQAQQVASIWQGLVSTMH